MDDSRLLQSCRESLLAVNAYAKNFMQRIVPVLDPEELKEEVSQKFRKLQKGAKRNYGRDKYELSHRMSEVYQDVEIFHDELRQFRKETLLNGVLCLYHIWERYCVRLLTAGEIPPGQGFRRYIDGISSLGISDDDINAMGLGEEPPGRLYLLWRLSNVIKHDNLESARELAFIDQTIFPAWSKSNPDLGLYYGDRKYWDDSLSTDILAFDFLRGRREDDRVFDQSDPYARWPCRAKLELTETHFNEFAESVGQFFKLLERHLESRPTR